MKCKDFKGCYEKGAPICNKKDCFIYRENANAYLVSGENQKEIRFNNKDHYRNVLMRIDETSKKAGIISKQRTSKACDEILIVLDKKDTYFIEYKGGKIKDAIKQIEESIKVLNEELQGFSINACIIHSSNIKKEKAMAPRGNSGEVNVLKINFKRKYKGLLHSKSNQLTIDL